MSGIWFGVYKYPNYDSSLFLIVFIIKIRLLPFGPPLLLDLNKLGLEILLQPWFLASTQALTKVLSNTSSVIAIIGVANASKFHQNSAPDHSCFTARNFSHKLPSWVGQKCTNNYFQNCSQLWKGFPVSVHHSYDKASLSKLTPTAPIFSFFVNTLTTEQPPIRIVPGISDFLTLCQLFSSVSCPVPTISPP